MAAHPPARTSVCRKNPCLIILRGEPGSGKTTYAHKLVEMEGFRAFSADDHMVINGKYVFLPGRLEKAHSTCQKEVKTALFMGSNVVVHNSARTRAELEPYLRMNTRAMVTVFKMTRSYGSTKLIPEHVMSRYRNTYEPHPDEESGYFNINEKRIVFENEEE